VIAVLFEVRPAEGRTQEYPDIAADLRPLLDGIDGFLSIERFASLSEPGKVLSQSFWRDEEAVRHWRSVGEHRAAQARGRAGIFASYRLRVAAVTRDYGMDDRAGRRPTTAQRTGSSRPRPPRAWGGDAAQHRLA
jgi:heme-degrading monooxygenase HmoA